MIRPSLATLLAGATLAPTASAQLLHRYSFDGQGTGIVDSQGTADGVAMGGATLTGLGSIVLDGADDFVERPGGLGSASDMRSFEAWFKWNPTGAANWQRLMDFGDSSGGVGTQGVGLTYLVISPQASTPQAMAGAIKTINPGVSQKVFANSPTPMGAIVHVVLTFDSPGDSMAMYVDGALHNTSSITENLSELNDVNCWLGQSQFTQDPNFEGSIDEFRVYGHALSAPEVAASFAAGPDGGVGVSYCQPAVANSTGVPAAMGASGSAVAASNDLVLEATDLPMSSFGFFLTSQMQGSVSNPGGSQGNLCLGGAIGRYVGPGQIQNSGAAGVISLTLDLTSTPTPTGLVSIAAGETWNFQAWYRDAVSGVATSNFTDGLEIVFL